MTLEIDRELAYLPEIVSIWAKGYMRMTYFRLIRLAVKHRAQKGYTKAHVNVGALQ